MEIDDFKNIWKAQKKEEVKISNETFTSVTDALKKSERVIIRRFIIMTIFMSYAVYFFVSRILSGKQYLPLTYIGFGLIILAIIIIFIMNWSTVISLRFKNISSPSIEFLQRTRVKLARRRFIRKTIIPVYLAAIAAGITFIYLDVLSGLSIGERILFHLLAYVLLFGISIIAIKKQNRRYEKDIKPIEEKIDALLADE